MITGKVLEMGDCHELSGWTQCNSKGILISGKRESESEKET